MAEPLWQKGTYSAPIEQSEVVKKSEKFKTGTIHTEVTIADYKLEYRVFKSKEEAEVERKKVHEQIG